MSEEIVIFDIPEEDVIPNKSQRQLEYEELEKKSRLSKHHFKSFYEMEELFESQQKPKSNVTSVVLKWVLQYCNPIVTLDEKTYSIPLQLEINTLASVDGRKSMIPSNTQFKVMGITIPGLFVKSYNKYMLSQYDHIDDNQLASSGHYGLIDFQTYRFTQQRDHFNHPGILPSLGNTIVFKDEQTTMDILNKIVNYIDFVEVYYGINFPALKYDMLELDKPNTNITVLPWKIRNGIRINPDDKIIPKSTRSNNLQPYDLSDNLLSMLNKVQSSNFGDSFYYDVTYMMEKNMLTRLYNIGENLGTDNKTFSTLYNKKQASIDYIESFQKQVNLADQQKLIAMRMQNIAFNKYNTTDLTTLDKKQIAVIDLEYKRSLIIAASDKTLANAFNKLHKSFTDSEDTELKSSLSLIEKLSSKKNLDGMELISGMCPHVYWQGKILLDNFNKIDMSSILREEIIHRYAGHNDDTGFYCKICGELIADPDNKSTVKFFGERSSFEEDDPLQSMLWKEAMYIVMANVKINPEHPIPIKPLVSSLSYGLRNIVASEEAKLYRSKTNTSESIKDTTNLYASIYIYAALCAMMLANPGKLSFGRDKPEESEKKLEDATESIESAKSRHVTAAMKQDAISKIEKKNRKENTSVSKVGNLKKSTETIHDTIVANTTLKNDNSDSESADVESNDGDNPDTIPFNTESNNSDNPDSDDEHSDSKFLVPLDEIKPAIAMAAGEKNRRISRFKKNRRKKAHRFIGGGVKTVDVKQAEKYFLNTAFKLIIISKESIISRLKSISVDFVKQILTKNAFPWAMKYAKPIDTKKVIVSSMYNDPVQSNPFYRYVHFAAKASSKKRIPFDDVKGLLGRDLDRVIIDLKHDKHAYDNVPVGNQWKLNSNVSNHSINYTSIPGSRDSLLDEYMYKSFVAMREYIVDRVYEKSMVPRHIQVTEYLEKYADLLELEKKIVTRTKRYLLRPNIDIPLANDFRAKYNNFDPKLLDLAQHYCTSGELHEAGSFIYAPVKQATGVNPVVAVDVDSSKLLEITKKDITTWLDTKEMGQLVKFANMKLINERCSKCKNTIRDSKSSIKSDKSLATMFKKIDDVLAFYQYYETRCPKGNLHDIIDTVCKKCNLSTEFSKKGNIDFYNTYSIQFQKIQREKALITINSLKEASIANNPKKVEIKESKPYTFSLKNTAEWSQVSGVKYNLIVNIGLFEGFKFTDLDAANVNPSKTETSFNTRILKLKGYILWVLRDYNTLINRDNLVELPIDLRDIFNAQKKISIEGIDKALPTFDDFSTNDLIHSRLPTDQYSNWLQEYLANIIVSINNMNDKFKMLATELVKYFTLGIITQEKILTKPTPFFLKTMDITEIEEGSGTEAMSGDQWANRDSASSDGEFEKDTAEVQEDEFDVEESFDLENVNDTFETE